MRVRDRLIAVVVTLAFVLAGLGSAAPPAAATASASGTSAVALRAPYPGISWSELVAGPWHDHGGGLGYTDGPDDLAPAALPRVAGPVVPEPVASAPRPPVVPLPPRGPLAARAPPAA
ncbi:hypothetical protein [Micromonospora sp. NPDC048169]|uniref:hypothetical protein n=1 Tax=unclassified Micromonospora TaxID=2617518 RepID=UPI0033D0D281